MILSVIILLAVAVGVLFISKSDASGSEKAMLIAVVCIGGVIGGAVAVGLLMTSPVSAAVALMFLSVFVLTFFGSVFGDALAAEKYARKSQITQTVSDASAESILRDFKNIKAGDEVNFGKYRWVVAEVKDDKAMFVTDSVILKMKLCKKDSAVTWENCMVRKYLNGRFLKSSFGEGEKSLILPTVLSNFDNAGDNMKMLPKTEDKIFIWSYKQAEKYAKTTKCSLPSDPSARECWTRTTRGRNAHIYHCTEGIAGLTDDSKPACVYGGVRPVMWVKIK